MLFGSVFGAEKGGFHNGDVKQRDKIGMGKRMGKKSLEEILNDSVVQPGIKDATKRLATFLSYWPEIEASYKNGWSWLQIYKALFREGIVDYTYSTFLYYKDKRYRRELEAARRDSGTRNADDAKGASVERPARTTPGVAKVELPVYGEVNRREPKRF